MQPKTFTDRIIGKNIRLMNIEQASLVDDDDSLKTAIRNKIFSWVTVSCSVLGGIWTVVQAIGYWQGWWCN